MIHEVAVMKPGASVIILVVIVTMPKASVVIHEVAVIKLEDPVMIRNAAVKRFDRKEAKDLGVGSGSQ